MNSMLTIIFITSLVLIIAMVWFKQFEENKQIKLFIPKLRARANDFASEIIRIAKNFFAILNGKNAKLFVLFGAKFILTGLSDIKRKIIVKKSKFTDSLKEDKNLSNKKKGPTSFFLKNVSEYKNNNYLK